MAGGHGETANPGGMRHGYRPRFLHPKLNMLNLDDIGTKITMKVFRRLSILCSAWDRLAPTGYTLLLVNDHTPNRCCTNCKRSSPTFLNFSMPKAAESVLGSG